MGTHYNKADFITYGKPSLFLDFANKKSLTDRISGNNLITFTRTSTATYVGADGLIKTAVADEARFDHDPTTGESLGLLIEESRTNLLTNSLNVTFSNSAANNSWSFNISAPDGSNDARKCTTNNRAFRDYSAFGNANVLSTYSVYLRADSTLTRTFEALRKNSGESLASKSITITEQWQRFDISFTSTTDGVRIEIEGGILGIEAWGCQLEAKFFPTSYIPTSGSVVTRTLDSAFLSTSNWWDYTQGTAYAEYRGGLESNQSGYGRVWSPFTVSTFIAGNASHAYNNRHSVWFGGTAIQLIGQEHLSAFAKNAITYSNNGTNCDIVSVSYPAITTGTTNSSVTSTTHGIGRNVSNTSNILNGHIKQLIYYPTILTNSQLQSRTK